MSFEFVQRRFSLSSVLFNALHIPLFKDFMQGMMGLPVELKRVILLLIDLTTFLIATYISFCLRFDQVFPGQSIAPYTLAISLTIGLRFCVFMGVGVYRSLLRHVGMDMLATVAKGILISDLLSIALSAFLQIQPLPRSMQITGALFTWMLIVGSRSLIGLILKFSSSANALSQPQQSMALKRSSNSPHRVIIYGAGEAGSQLARTLFYDYNYQVVGFVDDLVNVQGRQINRIPIYSPKQLPKLVAHLNVTMVLLAIPSATPSQKRAILRIVRGLPVEVKTVPSLLDLVAGKVSIGHVRNVDIGDLLGREEVLPDPSLLRVNITDKTVMVTGAGGSIGSEICRQIAQQQPKCIVLYELNEFALYSIDLELAENYPTVRRAACLGSVTDANRLEEICQEYSVQTIYHAAAYKHVPMVEANPAPGVLNNVYGTLTAAIVANQCQVETFVLISTDKAVRPTNVMGATKRAAELVLQSLAAQPETFTRFTMVRFGNVLDSAGSVVPRFRKQIAAGKPITLTHRDITRYFMSIPEASRLVIQAGALGQGGDVFLLEMGEPIRIYDLATQMIELSGLVPGEDIDIQITGLRPGEKLYEELLIDADAIPTAHPKIYSAQEAMIPWKRLEPMLDNLFLAAYESNLPALRAALHKLVPEYQTQPIKLAPHRPSKWIERDRAISSLPQQIASEVDG
jgi:FlaA1/EpsC-like NDP-sugar epimerase